MEKILKVINVSEIKDASTGNGKYQTITVQQFKIIETSTGAKEMATANIATRNLWSDRIAKDGSTIKGDIFFGTLTKGEIVLGEIVKFNTSSYDVNGRVVNSVKVMVFEGENSISVANSALASKNSCVVTDTGELTRDLSKISVVGAE